MTVSADRVVDDGGQVLVPVNEQMKEFIEAGNDRRDGEAETKYLKRLPARTAHSRIVIDGRNAC